MRNEQPSRSRPRFVKMGPFADTVVIFVEH